ncbi:MAG: hypothetical protein KDI80_08250 [Xanthomonadales bacterium]|nr:hypothetical protein [Xanthomonadales bacterium]
MSDFNAWRSWAAGLDEMAFARLWRALGAVAALRPMRGALDEWLDRVAAHAVQTGELGWTLPPFAEPFAQRLQGATAQQWLDRWQARIGSRLDKAPLRIADWPSIEDDPAWLTALYRVAPVASLRLPLLSKRMLGWPLRMAALEDVDRGALRDATGLWPASGLARVVGSDAQCFACDVLLLSGEFDAHAAKLDGGQVSANFIIARSAMPLSREVHARIIALVEATEAGGFVLFEDDPGIDLPGRINGFVEQLSHARRVDVAACLAFRDSPRPAIVGLCDELARFTILRVARRLQARSRNVQRATRLPGPLRAELDSILPHIPDVPAPAARAPSGLESLGSDTVQQSDGLESLGGDAGAEEAFPAADAEAAVPDYERPVATYEQESAGASRLVEALEALERAEAAVSANRYLQQRASIVRDANEIPASHGFVAGLPARVRVHIGPPDRESNALPEPFPEDALPQELDSWDLDVWLSEPTHLPQPLGAAIILHRTGNSTACTFEFTPTAAEPFNGRISVLHRGRVIQTAALRASVSASEAASANGTAPVLESVLQVKRRLADPDRRRYDLAYVLNHVATDQPVAHAIGGQRAWLSNLRVVEKTVEDINALLSGVARTARDYAGGLDSDKGKTLLRNLAELGNYLHLYLVEPQRAGAAGAARRQLFDGEFIQVVSTRSDAVVIPFEFIYEYDAPADDAVLCPHWRDALEAGRCPATCTHDETSFCPMGFWGLSKVIERHALQADLALEGEVGLQSEPVAGRDTLKIAGAAVFGSSARVKDDQLGPLRQRLLAAQLDGRQAADWADWKAQVGQASPSLLIALAHSDGAGRAATIEIGGKPIKTIGITAAHICANAQASEHPLVALLGCDMAGTGDDYANPVAVFSTRGAAAVVGTVATVLAEHSAEVAARLMQGLTFADRTQTRRLGEAMRELKRNALLDGELMPLCLIGFGDADWLLSN